METILSYLLGGFGFVQRIAEWAMANPLAALFYSSFLTVILDRIVKLTPWKGDDSALDIIEDALKQAVGRAFKR